MVSTGALKVKSAARAAGASQSVRLNDSRPAFRPAGVSCATGVSDQTSMARGAGKAPAGKTTSSSMPDAPVTFSSCGVAGLTNAAAGAPPFHRRE